MAGDVEEEITRDVAREARLKDLEDRTKTTTMGEIITGRSAGIAQADILSRTFAEDAPYRMREVTQRESTNVEDRRFVDEPIDPNAPLATGPRVVGEGGWTERDQAEYETHRLFGTPEKGPSLRSSTFRGSDPWSNVVQKAGDIMDDVRTTLDLWFNPGKFPVREGTSPEEQAVIAGNKESRMFTGAVDLATAVTGGGYSRAAPGLVGRALEGAPLLPHQVTELAAGGGKVTTTGGEVWGPKFQKLMKGEYEKAVAGEDYSTQLDILAAKYNGSPNDPPAMRTAMKAEIDRLRALVDPATTLPEPPQTAAVALSTGRTPPTKRALTIPLEGKKGPYEAVQDTGDPREWKFMREGKEIGHFSVIGEQAYPNRVTIDGIQALSKGEGLAEPVYRTLKQRYENAGMELVPSAQMKDGTKHIWEKVDPDLLARGRYVRQEQDDGSFWWVRTDPDFSPLN